MQKNRPGLGVLGQIVDQVVVIDVHAITQGQEVREAHPPGKSPVQHRTGNGAGLPHEGNAAGNGPHMGIGGVQMPRRHHQTDGVGAQHADTGFPGGIPHRIHQWLAGFTVGP